MASYIQLRNALCQTKAVRAGWAFGVPEDGREQWLEHVITAVQQTQAANSDILHHDDETLNKVLAAMIRSGLSMVQARDAIREMQNDQILFRELR